MIFIGRDGGILSSVARHVIYNLAPPSSPGSRRVKSFTRLDTLRFPALSFQYKRPEDIRSFVLAGAGGIEPTLTVLETVVLPLYDAPLYLLVS